MPSSSSEKPSASPEIASWPVRIIAKGPYLRIPRQQSIWLAIAANQ